MCTANRPFGPFVRLHAATSKQSQTLIRKRSDESRARLLTLVCASMFLSVPTCCTALAAPFTAADFEGIWNLHMLTGGYPDDFESWAHGTMTCNSDGQFTIRATNRTEDTNVASGTLQILPDGVIASASSSDGSGLHGVMNRERDLVVFTINDGGGGYDLVILTKAGGSFVTGDLEGTWNMHALASGDDLGAWASGTFVGYATGMFRGSYVTSTGHLEFPSGTLNISSDGIISASTGIGITPSTFHGALSRDKSIMVCTGTGGDNSYQLCFFTKAGGTFRPDDLPGTWHWHGLTSGHDTDGHGWFHYTTTIDSSGDFSVVPDSYLDSSGETDIARGGTMSISANGILTIPGKPDAHGTMSSRKDIIVMTRNHTGGGYDLAVAVRACSADVQAIEDAYARMETALEDEDIDTLMSCFSADYLHDGRDRNHRRSEFQRLFDRYQNIRAEFSDMQITINGNIATTKLHVRITGEPQSSGGVETVMDQDMSAGFFNYWLKKNGTWELNGNQPSMIPMVSFDFTHGGYNGLNIYLYDCASESMNTVKQNTYDSHGASLNADHTMIVYTEGWCSNPYTIKVYDIASRSSTAIATDVAELAAYFDKSGKILFIHSGTGVLKKMDTDGTNITAVANPEPPYSFAMFWMSPDRERIVATEGRQEGPDYKTGRYERLALIDLDTTERTVIMGEYLGEWNLLSWRPDSSGFLYYHHQFNGLAGEAFESLPKYLTFDLTIEPPIVTDLSRSDLGKEENLCLYTRSGNLLSLAHRELCNGQTGTLIADRSSDVPPITEITETMVGADNNGDIYFADLNDSNLRKFMEIRGDFHTDGKLDFDDFCILAAHWLQADGSFACGGTADLTNDGAVNFPDFAALATNWLTGTE